MVNVYFRGFRTSPEWLMSQYISGVVVGLHWIQLASYEDTLHFRLVCYCVHHLMLGVVFYVASTLRLASVGGDALLAQPP